MKKIWIGGSPGSGKSTLANMLGNKLNIPTYHADTVCFKENWRMKPESEITKILQEITKKDKWIYEGARYPESKEDGRFDNCDTIIYLNINRFICMYRAIRRWLRHYGSVLPEHYDGNKVFFGRKLAYYILFRYPTNKLVKKKLFEEAQEAGKTVIILNGRMQVQKFYDEFGLLS